MSELAFDNIGDKGLNTDRTPWSLGPEFLTYGLNFRVFAGGIESSGGYKNWSTCPTSFHPGYLQPSETPEGNLWAVCGVGAVWAFDGTVWGDISSGLYPSINEGDQFLWTGCELGTVSIFNNSQHYPEYWLAPGINTTLVPLDFRPGETFEDVGISCKVIRSHKAFLFALNLVDDGTELPDSYRWSTAADANTVPLTWDELDLSALAGKASLGSSGGSIIDGLSLRDSFIIYSEHSINVLDYTGDAYVWRRRELSSTSGLLSKNAIVEVKGTHFFLADGDILKNDGTNISTIIHGRLRDQFTTRINPDFYYRSYVVKHDPFKEIWFCIPVDSAEYPNVAFVYNWHEDAWSVRVLPYAHYTDIDTGLDVITEAISYAAYGSQEDATLTWADWEGTWETQRGIWGSNVISPMNKAVVGVDEKTSTLRILTPRDRDDSPEYKAIIERTDFPLLGHKAVTTITKVIPHMTGASNVLVQIGSQDYVGAPVRWKPPVDFNPSKQRHIDVRSTGELHAWRVSSSVRDDGIGNWGISGMSFEYQVDGQR